MNDTGETKYVIFALTPGQMKKAGVPGERGFLALPKNPTKPAQILTKEGKLAKEITVAEAFKL